jgi:hypothetical protein
MFADPSQYRHEKCCKILLTAHTGTSVIFWPSTSCKPRSKRIIKKSFIFGHVEIEVMKVEDVDERQGIVHVT